MLLAFGASMWGASWGPAEIDPEALAWVVAQRQRFPALTDFFRFLTRLGDPPATYFLILSALAVLGGLAARRIVPAKWTDLAYWVGVALAGRVVQQSLKQLVRRERPPVVDRLVTVDSFSFPSGHSTFSAAYFGALILLLYPVLRRRSRSLAVLMVVHGTATAVAIGASRVWLGVHYPTDVIGGLALGGFWVWAAHLVQSRVLSGRVP
jgi:undecaprenyl-diphosphatase